MNSISNRLGMIALVFAFLMVFAIAPSAHAADLGDWGWSDYGTYDTWSDYGTYDTYADYGTYDDWSDYGTYAPGTYYDDGSGAYYDDSYGTYYDDYAGTYYDDYAGTYYDDYSGTYYDGGYGTYYDDYDYGCGSYCGGGFDYGCGSLCGGGYGYSIPSGCSFCGGYSIPPAPRYPTVTVGQPGYASSYVSNTNTNTNVNTITNIDNSINDSFNTYNSNNTVIAQATPQTPIVYTTPSYPAPYCVINNAQGQNGMAYIAWSSANAISAYLSNVGSVAVSGAQTVSATGGAYTLTVYGQNGQSATCATTVYAPAPYVALTQIPYTGFDFGPIGNAIYWASLLGFAIAGAYLAIYYRGGALAFATAMVPARKPKFAPVVAPKAPVLVEKEALAAHADEEKIQPVVSALRKAGTVDSMAIVQSKDGSMPKIVISRG